VNLLRAILRIRRKGVIIIPKGLREAVGFNEGDEVIAEVTKEGLLLRKFTPIRVCVDRRLVEELLREESILEERKYAEILGRERVSD